MNNIELQKLRDLPIEGVAERLGLRVTRHRCLCPFHEDHHPSLSFNLRTNTYRCWSCGASGGTIDLAMHLLPSRAAKQMPLGQRSGGGSFLDACRWLGADTISQNVGEPSNAFANRNASCKSISTSLPLGGDGGGHFDASRYERFFEHPWLSPEAQHFLYDERRLDPRVIRWCRITSWRDRNGTPWLQTPYYDQDGKLIGIQNRNLQKGALPRFRFPQGQTCRMYNLPILRILAPDEHIYLAEGPSDTWSLLSAGHKALGIPSATLLKPDDLIPLKGRICHIYPDNDAAGEALYQRLVNVANDIGFAIVRHQLPPGCKDFSDYYVINLTI